MCMHALINIKPRPYALAYVVQRNMQMIIGNNNYIYRNTIAII